MSVSHKCHTRIKYVAPTVTCVTCGGLKGQLLKRRPNDPGWCPPSWSISIGSLGIFNIITNKIEDTAKRRQLQIAKDLWSYFVKIVEFYKQLLLDT